MDLKTQLFGHGNLEGKIRKTQILIAETLILHLHGTISNIHYHVKN